jgi:hypothetical protein
MAEDPDAQGRRVIGIRASPSFSGRRESPRWYQGPTPKTAHRAEPTTAIDS